MNDLVLTLLVLAALVMGGLWFWNRLEAKRSQETQNPNLAQEGKSVYDRLKEMNPIGKTEEKKESIGLFDQPDKSEADDVQEAEVVQPKPMKHSEKEAEPAPKTVEKDSEKDTQPAQKVEKMPIEAEPDVIDATSIFQLPKTGHLAEAASQEGSKVHENEILTPVEAEKSDVLSATDASEVPEQDKESEKKPEVTSDFKVKIDVDAKAVVREVLGTGEAQASTQKNSGSLGEQASLFDTPAKTEPTEFKKPVSIANSRGTAVADPIKKQEPYKPDNLYDQDDVPSVSNEKNAPKGYRDVPYTHLSETMANILCRHPVNGKQMMEMYKNLNRTNLNLRVYVRHCETGRWLEPNDMGMYNEMAVVMRLAGRDFCINDIDASRFTMAVQSVCIALDAESESENAPEMVQRAQLLHNSIQKLNGQLTFVIVSHEHPSVVEIQTEAQAAGFMQINTQRYALATPQTLKKATMWLTQRDYDTRTLYLTMSAPLVDPQSNPVRTLFTIANDLCARLNAELQDNSGNPITAASAQLIQKQITFFFKSMRSAGITPGSDLARELFSQDEE